MTDRNKVLPEDKPTAAYLEEAKKLDKGPMEQRSCTDVLCCLIFLASIGVSVYLTIVAYTKGDIWRLLAPWDPGKAFVFFWFAR